jgi:hypothetical protein
MYRSANVGYQVPTYRKTEIIAQKTMSESTMALGVVQMYPTAVACRPCEMQHTHRNVPSEVVGIWHEPSFCVAIGEVRDNLHAVLQVKEQTFIPGLDPAGRRLCFLGSDQRPQLTTCVTMGVGPS